MGYKRVIQLRGLKDKVTKRYFVNIRFYHNSKFIFEGRYDINDLVIDNGWESISSAETMIIFPTLFGIYTGKYPLLNREYSDRTGHWLVKEEWGFSISLLDEDLATIRNKKIKDLGV